MFVSRHSLEVDFYGVVTGYERPTAHAPATRADLHATACFRFHQDEKMAAFGGGFRQRRPDGGSGGAAADLAVAVVPEVENGEVKSLTAADEDA